MKLRKQHKHISDLLWRVRHRRETLESMFDLKSTPNYERLGLCQKVSEK